MSESLGREAIEIGESGATKSGASGPLRRFRFAYFPGCSLESTAKEYDLSARRVCPALGVELQEIPDWNCCGATPAHSTNHLLGVALPARSLAKAEALGLDVAAPCAACFNRLKTARHEILESVSLGQRVQEITGASVSGKSQVRNLLDVIANTVGEAEVASRVRRPLQGLKAVSYYGCMLVRPSRIIQFDDPEDPKAMDRLVAATGAEATDWPFKTECCGAALALSRTDVMVRMVGRILEMARIAGANCIVTACPLCHVNLDTRQRDVERSLGTRFGIPVYYFTQLLGLAMGYSPRQMGLHRHLVDPMELLQTVGLAS
ncbi:MAG: CoB--CoM heterodisulfide reductase iron-sulfur subunit B family protein [Firmicutes bacterium]|nr:CoB--CoM heterodisulfide reductase iron-sulfur subunit B family protein [Bacillota bacterium]